MKTIAFIPIRSGSIQIEHKNIKLFNSFPLIYWSIKSLYTTPSVDEVYIASDQEYIHILENLKKKYFPNLNIYLRDKQNSTAIATTESVMLEFINSHKNILNDDDIFILKQNTSPLVSKNHIEEALHILKTDNKDSLLSAVLEHKFLWTKKGTPINYSPENRPRRQEWDGNIVENGAFYISYIKNILKSSCRISGDIGFYIMDPIHSFEIDSEFDWELLEYISSRYRHWGNYKNIIYGNKNEYLVKLLFIEGGESLSLQKHMKREEIHILIDGNIRLYLEDKEINMEKFIPYFIKKEEIHRFENLSSQKAIIVEIQHGIIEESDIFRL